MPLDAYSPCPCGSGKKLKFCCQAIVDEMEKVVRFQDNNQPKMALQLLDGLEKSHPENAWVKSSRAAILLEEGEPEQSLVPLRALLERQPDHTFAIALYAGALFSSQGFDAARPAIERAFQRCENDVPDIIANLALGIAAVMFGRGKYLAARQYLTLAMRLSDDQSQQQTFVRLLEFDGSSLILYPLRSVRDLARYSGSDETSAEVRKAIRLVNVGCASLAADLFAALAEREPNNPVLWENAGVCRAWDGDETAAATLLHRAADMYDDREKAIECEMLAQLLDINTTEDRIKVGRHVFRVKSVGRLLTQLDCQDRIVRTHIPKDDHDDPGELPAGIYQILDRSPQEHRPDERPASDAIRNVFAQVTIFNGDAEQHAEAHLIGLEGDELDAGLALFRESAGDEVEPAEQQADGDEPLDAESISREFAPIRRNWYIPPGMAPQVQLQFLQDHLARFAAEVWPNTNLHGLGGKTPNQAKGDPALATRLAAAVYVLDAYCDQHGYVLDLDATLKAFELQPPEPIEATPETSFNAYSFMQMQRVALGSLSDAQVLYTMNRALLVHQRRFLDRVLTEVASRPACLQQVDPNRVFSTLADRCRDRLDHAKALEWIARGLEAARASDRPFENELQWKVRELTARLADPNDPQLLPLMKQLWDVYGAKVPQVRQLLQNVAGKAGITPPWQASGQILTPESAPAAGVWTPGRAPETPAAGKKLWVPGQE